MQRRLHDNNLTRKTELWKRELRMLRRTWSHRTLTVKQQKALQAGITRRLNRLSGYVDTRNERRHTPWHGNLVDPTEHTDITVSLDIRAIDVSASNFLSPSISALASWRPSAKCTLALLIQNTEKDNDERIPISLLLHHWEKYGPIRARTVHSLLPNGPSSTSILVTNKPALYSARMGTQLCVLLLDASFPDQPRFEVSWQRSPSQCFGDRPEITIDAVLAEAAHISRRGI